MDDVDGFDGIRSRVLLDDVMHLTLHQRSPWGLFWTSLLLMVFFGASGERFLLKFLPIFLAMLLALTIRMVFGVHCVSVFGRRSKMRMAFYLRGGRAREVFALLVERTAQRRGPRRGAPAEPQLPASMQPGG